MTRVVGVSVGTYVTEEPDGSRYLNQGIPGFDPVVCGTGPNQTTSCAGPFVPIDTSTLTPARAAEISLALLQQGVDATVQVIGPLGDAAISSLSQTGIQRLSPTLAQFTLNPDPQIAAAITQLGLGQAIELTGLAPAIRSELAQSTDQLLSSGELQKIRPDPGDPSLINMYQRYASELQTTQRLAPLVAEYRETSMGLLDELGLGSFGGFNGGFSLNDANAQVPSYDATVYYPPGYTPVTDGGGILGGIGSVLGQVGTSVLNNLPAILQLGARTGLIRGTVGEALGYQPVQTASVAPMSALGYTDDPCARFSGFEYALCRANQIVLQNQNPYVLNETAQQCFDPVTQQPVACPPGGTDPMTMPISPSQLAANSGLCGQRRTTVVDMMSAPGIFRLGCGGYKPVAKVIAQRMDGRRDLFVRVGEINSPSPRVVKRFAKRWAKEAGLSVHARGGPRRRAYRRRRPR